MGLSETDGRNGVLGVFCKEIEKLEGTGDVGRQLRLLAAIRRVRSKRLLELASWLLREGCDPSVSWFAIEILKREILRRNRDREDDAARSRQPASKGDEPSDLEEQLQGVDGADDLEIDGNEIVFVRVPGSGQLEEFWLGRYEVTREEFGRFLASESVRPSRKDWERYRGSGDYPAVGVWLDDAEAFCKWGGYRLPTDAEWQRAWKCGAISGGESLPIKQRAWFDETEGPHAVGQLFPDRLGLCDLQGNAWEWSSTKSPGTEPDKDGGPPLPLMLLNGGCWMGNEEQIYRQERCTASGWEAPAPLASSDITQPHSPMAGVGLRVVWMRGPVGD